MTRSLMPAVSIALALTGLPAAAAELGDAAALSVDIQTVGDAVSDDTQVPATAPAPEVVELQANRKGKARAGGRARARSGGRQASARAGQAATRSSQRQATAAVVSAEGRTPTALRSTARGGAPGAVTRTDEGGQRPLAIAPRSTTAQRSAAGRSGRLVTPARSSSGESAGSTSARGHGQGSSAQRPGDGPRPETVRGRPGRGSPAARPSARPPARPAARHRVQARRHVVHHPAGLPIRWAPSWHRYHLRGVPHYSPRYWAAGVFIYSPPPRGHKVVVVDGAGHRIKDAPAPSRAVDRNNTVSIGLRGGSYLSGYQDGTGYGDMGLGLSLSYRPVEAIGLDLTWMHHSDSWDEYTERAQDPISASVELFAFPWTRVSPYAFVGLTATPRAADDTYFNGLEQVHYQATDALFGPHAGLGIEFAVGQSASLSFDGRYIGYVDVHEGDTTLPGALQGQMGLNFYF